MNNHIKLYIMVFNNTFIPVAIMNRFMGVGEEQKLSSHDEKELKRQRTEEERERQSAAALTLQKNFERKKYVKWGVLGAIVILVLYGISGLFCSAHLEIGD